MLNTQNCILSGRYSNNSAKMVRTETPVRTITIAATLAVEVRDTKDAAAAIIV